MQYSEKEKILQITLEMLSKAEGFDDLRTKCEQIKAEGIISDDDIERYQKEIELKKGVSDTYERHKQHIISVQRDTEYLNRLLSTEATGVDRYFALTKYRSKYVENPNFIDRFTSSSLEENEWAKQFFIKEDGTFKTKSEVKEEIKELYISAGIESYDLLQDTTLNRKERNDIGFESDISRLAQLLGKDNSVGLLKKLKVYDSIPNIVYDFKDQMAEKIVELKEELSVQQKVITKSMDNKDKEINELGLTDEFRNICESQISTFGNDLSTGDRFPSPIERLRKETKTFEYMDNKSNVAFDKELLMKPSDIENAKKVISQKSSKVPSSPKY